MAMSTTLGVLVAMASLATADERIPITPTNIKCSAEPSSVSVSFTPSPNANLYDVAVTSGDRKSPFASFTTKKNSHVQILGLKPTTTVKYSVQVRAHGASFGKTQMMGGWSNFSALITCLSSMRSRRDDIIVVQYARTPTETTLPIQWWLPLQRHDTSDSPRSLVPSYTVKYTELSRNGPTPVLLRTKEMVITGGANRATISGLVPDTEYVVTVSTQEAGIISEPVALKTASNLTMFLEVVRVSEHMLKTVDFLANHNAGNVEGDTGFLTFTQGQSHNHFYNFTTSPRVKYCTEILKVNLSGTKRTSVYPLSIPTDERFSDYLSCNGPREGDGYWNYTCICDNVIDRVIAHQSKEQIESVCDVSQFANTCNCIPESLQTSAKYVGFMPTSFPFGPPAMGPNWPPPAPKNITAYGGWFHFPSAVKCDDDDSSKISADGCTWKRHPLATILYGSDLLAAGWNASSSSSNAEVYNNVHAMRSAYNSLDANDCCGCIYGDLKDLAIL